SGEFSPSGGSAPALGSRSAGGVECPAPACWGRAPDESLGLLQSVQSPAQDSLRPDAAMDEEPMADSADRRFEVVETTIPQIQAALDAGRLTCQQLVQQYLRRIRAYDQRGPHLNAIRDLNPRALQIARELDRERRHFGRRGPLHCIPVLLKDNIDT